MNGERLTDIMVCSFSAAVMVLSYCYVEQETIRRTLCVAAAVAFCLFLILAIADRDRKGRPRRHRGKRRRTKGGIHVLALLDEEDRIVTEWNIAGKTSLLIGRDTRREDVDINLANTAFGGMVDRQHAVLNYTAGQWYIEDLDSTNGIRIRKPDGRIYEVSKTQPCQVEKGDILFIGLTRLAAE
ncbi:MAG: FHA domain-containing protein [Butyrivibrio sp.]|nr:FHA domain-containing protein [Butyrivibrio sp.]